MMLMSPALSGGRLGAADTNLPTSLCVAARPPARERSGGTVRAVSPGRDTGVKPGADVRSLPSSGQLPGDTPAAVSAVGASDTRSDTRVGTCGPGWEAPAALAEAPRAAAGAPP